MSKHKHKRSSSNPTHSSVHPNAYHVYTDGSFRPEDNASCAYLIFSERSQHVVKMDRFVCRGRTINQMELEAVNRALDYPNMEHVLIYSDSAYTISCLTLWHHTWAQNNWMNHLREPVKNKELVQEILAKMALLKSCNFMKVKAHTGDPLNSVVDYMCQDLSFKMRDDPTLPNGVYP